MNKSDIVKAFQKPHLIGHWAYFHLYRNLLMNTGVEIMDEDWDNLIILDACRYDIFSDVYDIEGDLTSVISKGSHTVEFLRNNFDKNTYFDTVYISATPQIKWVELDNNFHKTIHIWKDGWNEELKTVPPKVVQNEAIEAASNYPNKRLIVHFVQPHYPFIGCKGQNIRNSDSIRSGLNGENQDDPTVWDHLRRGDLSKDDVWEAYQENLEIVLGYVENLITRIDGRTVITSDHGNAFGEWGLYGHPGKKATEELIKVPWLDIESERHRNIIENPPNDENSVINSEIVNKRLKDLGYK